MSAGIHPWRSFRFRIAALGAALSGLVLVAFGAYAIVVVDRLNLANVDDQIRDVIRRNVHRPGDADYWEQVDASLAMFYGDADDAAFMILVKNHAGETVFQSWNWPEDLSAERFPSPREPVPEFLPPPRFGPRGEGRDGPYPRGPRFREFETERQGRPPGPPPRQGRGPGPGGPPAGPPIPPREHGFFTWRADGTDWRVGAMSSPHTTLAVGLSMGHFGADSRALRRAFYLALPIGLVLIGAASYLLSERALRPIMVLADATERITARGLHERIALEDQDAEFERLITVFNGMLKRLERGFHQASRFSADAAHELKTPLAILQGELERGVQEAAPASAEQARYSELLEQVQRLKAITRKLLLLARADAGQLQLNLEEFPFSEAVEAACDDAAILAPNLEILRRIAPEVSVRADGDLLPQVIQNLITNAVNYNQPGGRVEVYLRARADAVKLTVSNTGPGIPEADRERVFERFYRADKARDREKGGAGLGLSLAREIARTHGGDLVLEQTPPGITAFTLRLPPVRPVRAG